MIEFFTWSSPNGAKVRIMLEETGLEYEIYPINLDKGEHKQPDFLAINPNGRIPAIIDWNGPGGNQVTVFESGAILLYLAEKSGAFLPEDPADRWRATSWLMFQVAGIGPSLSQAGYYLNRSPEPVPHAVERSVSEAERTYGVVDRQLAKSQFLAGEYSIADMASYPWMRNHQRFGLDIADYPNVSRWLEAIAARPAVARSVAEF